MASFALSMELASLPKNYYVHLSHVGNMWLQLGESESQTGNRNSNGNSNSNRAAAETQSQSQCQNHFTYSCTRRTLLLTLRPLPVSSCMPLLPATAAAVVVAIVILVQCRLLCKWIRLFCKMSIAVGLQLQQKLLLGATVASEWFCATHEAAAATCLTLAAKQSTCLEREGVNWQLLLLVLQHFTLNEIPNDVNNTAYA